MDFSDFPLFWDLLVYLQKNQIEEAGQHIFEMWITIFEQKYQHMTVK